MQNVVTDPMSKYQTKLPLSFVKNSGRKIAESLYYKL